MSKRLLVLGGTEFVGRAAVEEALAAGWTVDVLNRGNHPPLPGTRALTGDRTQPGGLDALRDGEWDAVVDTWSWAPAAVRDAANLLQSKASHYVYISSRSVYKRTDHRDAENAPTVEASPDDTGFEDYARAKAGGELAVANAFGDRALLVRAGLILGPYENIGRLPWWLNRIADGGATVAPGPKDAGLQYIDARDLVRWALKAAAEGVGGAFDTVSQPGHTTMVELLETCIKVTGSDAVLHWRDPEAILDAGIQPWVELPIWLPPGELYQQLHQADVSKVHKAGLVCRPVAETIADTWAWLTAVGGVAPSRPDRPQQWLTREKERLVLSP